MRHSSIDHCSSSRFNILTLFHAVVMLGVVIAVLVPLPFLLLIPAPCLIVRVPAAILAILSITACPSFLLPLPHDRHAYALLVNRCIRHT